LTFVGSSREQAADPLQLVLMPKRGSTQRATTSQAAAATTTATSIQIASI
jgi:hypothetical protein